MYCQFDFTNKELCKIIENFSKSIYPKGGIIIIASFKDKIYYWHCDEQWSSFDNETISENPVTYKTLRGVISKIKRIGEGFPVVWIHPDCIIKPLEKYLSMFGNRFPGHVSQ